MNGLASVLAAPEYASLGGSTGVERLRNLFHNYALAKWIDNPSPSFYGGRYGFSRGINPSATPGFFDNTFLPCAKNSAKEIPPRFLVGAARNNSDSTYAIGSEWTATDTNQGINCNQSYVLKDTTKVWLYGTDYLQFDADPYFASNGMANTLHFRLNWDAATYPGQGTGNNIRVSAIPYSVGGDSLYTKGAYAMSVIEATIDTLHGYAYLWVPNFGTSVAIARLTSVTCDHAACSGRSGFAC